MLPTDYDPSNFYPTAPHRSPPTDRVWRLVDEVTGLTLIEAAELSNIMMERFCKTMTNKLSFKERYVIRLTRPDVVVAEKSDGGKPESKRAFDLRIESFEVASKLKVIKEIRGFMELGLKEAKELVEKAPCVLKKGVVKEEAQQIIEKMKAIGANVVMV
ncbi:50S ribosomal protein l7/l12 [Phtheirospermum japonicum]|uniref:50S ribosomal protein l7/l12 n=1 Tax=Phtheirospermum japonicum TaxID=374723 RepID=A0A830C4M4_9LAMI|nr:50S ribosomal protein l7/l12 [Phtheirospermum japonicum]